MIPPAEAAAVVAAVEDAASMALRAQQALMAGAPDAPRVWDKAPGQPVCDADLAVDAHLRAALGAILPAAGWLSEETEDDLARLAAPAIWCVDPIDGTRDFVRGRSGWAVSVALIVEGSPVLGILAAPARGELWTAAVGEGARRNGQAIRVSDHVELRRARVPAHQLPRAERDLVAVAQPNSIALRLAMVASGAADLVATQRWGAEWDVAAAALIVGQAGGVVTDAFGRALSFNQARPRLFGLAAANPALHPAVVGRWHAAARAAHAAGAG